MRKLLFFLFLPVLVFAQIDSTKVSFSEEKVAKFEKTTLIDEYEKAFGGNRIVKSALRVGIGNFSMYSGNNADALQFEKKIGVDKSIVLGIKRWGGINDPTLLSLEPRWYYKMKERVDAGLQNPNITGKYVGLRFENNFGRRYSNYKSCVYNNFGLPYIGDCSFSEYSLFNEKSSVALTYGRQFGNNVNYAINIGIKKGFEVFRDFITPQTILTNTSTWFISSNSKIGTGFYFPRKRKINSNMCDFLGCNYQVNQLFKLNLNNTFYVDKYNQKVFVDVSYERKIGKSPFSLNSNLVLGFNSIKDYKPIGLAQGESDDGNGNVYNYYGPIYSKEKENIYAFNFQINEQLRYYMGMNRRIAKGKSASNLNGFYTGLELAYEMNAISFLDSPYYNFYGNYNSSFAKMGLTVGYQTQTNRKSFVDISGTFGSQAGKYSHINRTMSYSYFNLNLKLGLAR